MGRTAKDRRDKPGPRPVTKIELSDKHLKVRLVAAVAFLLVGVTALAGALNAALTPESGWQSIQASGSAGATCADEFVFLYDLGSGGASALAENKAITTLYTNAAREAYQRFNCYESFDGMVNVFDLNQRPNQVLTVDETLYQAFATVQASGDRTLYLGPVHARYDDLFSCQDDAQLIDFDPRLSEEVRQEYSAIAAFAADPMAVDVQLLGDGQVRLYVSEEYLAYADREGIERFIDFSWMKNAFIVDHFAQVMTDSGYTHGTISSYDGFVRNLDSRAVSYSLNLYDRDGGTIYPAAVMNYTGTMSIVSLRDYPIAALDKEHYYQLDDGEIRTPYLDIADGACRSAVSGLTAYSKAQGCAEILLQVCPIYIADSLEERALDALAERGIHSVYCEGRTIFSSDPGLDLVGLYDDGSIRYTMHGGT